MTESLTAGGKSIRLEVHQPPRPPGAAPTPAIVLLHGAGGNTGFWLDRLAPHLAGAGVALFAPHYFDRTGTVRADLSIISDGTSVPQWLDTIRATLHHVAARPGIDPHRIALVGISLGAFLALALAALNSASTDAATRKQIRCLVDLSGGLVEPYAAQATSAFPPTLILHGDADTIVSPTHARSLDAQLTGLRVPHETRILANEGHWFSAVAQLQLLMTVAAFLRRHL